MAVGVSSMTDITGFGLLGHGSEVAEASGVTLRLRLSEVPLMTGARAYADRNIFPGGSADNKAAFESIVRLKADISHEDEMLLYDAQTSGGLLISLPPEKVEEFQTGLTGRGGESWRIGDVLPRDSDIAIQVKSD